MGIFIKLAVRNVHKNLRQIALNGTGITLTVTVLLFILAFSRGIENQIVQRNIRFETGGISIRLDKEITGWEKKAEGDSLYAAVTAWLDGNPSVKEYRPRISVGNALIYGKEGTQRIRLEGMDSKEYPLLREMVEIIEGGIVGEQGLNSILISREMAEENGLTLLDECPVVLPSADGSVNMQDFVVTGIFQNTSQTDKFLTYLPYEQAKSLYHTNLPTRILVDVTDLDEAEYVASTLKRQVFHRDMEVKTYKEFMGRAQALSGINRYSMLGMAFFLLFISFVGIWAMETEQLNERRKEIGSLLTFGFSRRSIKKIFLYESLYVSLLFLAAGCLITLAIIGTAWWHEGIYMGQLAAFAFGSSTILPELKGSDILIVGGLALLYPLVATWLSLQSMKRIPVIRLLNEKY